MKHTYPRSQLQHVLGILLDNERSGGRSFTPREDESLLMFYDQDALPHILDLLESMGYITQHRMRVGDIHNIRLTDAGRSYFQSQANQRHALWLQLRFNLIEAVLLSLGAFIAGLIAEHYLTIIGFISRLITSADIW